MLLTGETDAILLDGVFTWTQGRALAEAIVATGKRLTTIFVSCNDPDFYFGLAPIKAAFPEVRVLAAPQTVQAIADNVEEKLVVWRDKLCGDGPGALADLVLPQPTDADALMLDGERIELVATHGMFDRRYIWVPALRGIFGGTLIISGVHVWMADTPKPETIAAWIAALDEIEALAPEIVVPGHMIVGAPLDIGAVRYTRNYMRDFQAQRALAKDSSDLIARIELLYPNLPGTMWMELGAKVVMDEIQWGRPE